MKFLVLVAAIGSSSLQAAPIYLSCTVDQSGKILPVEITADETEQRATVVLPTTGRVVTVKALFSPGDVTILDGIDTWAINRVDLGFRRILTIGQDQSTYTGKCTLKPAPAKRAF